MAGSFARNSMYSAIAGLFTTLGGFASTILVARLLGVEGTGAVAFAAWIVATALTVADLGAPGSLARYLPELGARGEDEAARGLVLGLFRPFLGAVLLITGAFLAYAAWLRVEGGAGDGAAARTSPVFWAVVAGAFMVQAFGAFLNGYLKGSQDFRGLARLAAASGGLQLGTTLLGGLLYGVPGALLGAVAVGVLPSLALASRLPRRGRLGPELRSRVTGFALKLWGTYLVTGLALSRTEIFFLERSWGSEAVGLFAVSLTLANLASQGLLLLTGGLMPYLAQHVGSAPEKADEAFAAATRVIAFLVFPSCLGLVAVAPVLLPLIYGPAFAPAIPTAEVLIAAAGVTGATAVAAAYVTARERNGFLLAAGAGSAALTVLAGLTIVPAYGPLGAALARGAIQIAAAALLGWFITRRLNGPMPWGSLARLLLAALACAITARAVLGSTASPWVLALAIPAGIVAYAVAVRLLGALPGGDAARLAGFARILPGPLARIVGGGLRLLASAS